MADAKVPETPAPEAPAAPAPEVQAVESAPSKAVENVKETANKVTGWMKNFSSTNSGKVIVMLVLGIALAFLTGYILYYGINKTISNRQSYLFPETKVPILATQETTLSADKVPASGNGKRSTLSFWIYIYDIQKYNGVMRHVLHRGTETGKDIDGGASPYIYLDAQTNKLYITYGAADTSKLFKNGPGGNDYSQATVSGTGITGSPIGAGASGATDPQKRAYLNATRGITLDYIPLQRWVHVVVVVNEDVSSGGSITAYVDGEYVKSVTSKTDLSTYNLGFGTATDGTSLLSGKAVPTFNVTDVDLDKKGNFYVGGSTGSAVGAGFSGMVSMIQLFNYDLNANDVYSLYQKGPVDNMLAKVGLPAYGIQSPIYRIG